MKVLNDLSSRFKKMDKIKSKFNDFLKIFSDQSIDQLKNLKSILFFFIIIDLFVFNWYFKWKKLSISLLLVIIVFVSITLYYLNEKQTKEIIS